MLEAIIGFETKNKYVIKNSLGQPVYKVSFLCSSCQRSKCSYVKPMMNEVIVLQTVPLLSYSRRTEIDFVIFGVSIYDCYILTQFKTDLCKQRTRKLHRMCGLQYDNAFTSRVIQRAPTSKC